MESKKKKPSSPYERAKKRVNDIKGFYGHLAIYIIVCLVVLLGNGRARFIFLSNEALGNPEFLNWIDLNVYGTPIVWGVFVIIHGLNVFKINPFFSKKWEARQIEKYMNKHN